MYNKCSKLSNLILLFYLLKCLSAKYLSQRYKKQGEFGQIIQKSEKQKTKKRASSPEPLASCKKSLKAFSFFTNIKLLPKNQSFFLPLKNKLQLPIKNT